MISLSNFIKQRYVINLENEKVIINSDDKYMAQNGQRMDSISFPSVEVVPDSIGLVWLLVVGSPVVWCGVVRKKNINIDLKKNYVMDLKKNIYNTD